jgi:3-hydroxyisobutyrate dehydrogenase
MLRIAFNGLGTMGAGMARRLIAAGFPVTVYNRDRSKTGEHQKQGARVAATPAEAAADAEVVISMVADDVASRSVWTGETGVLAGVRNSAVLIESSTITPAWARELGSVADARGCAFLDAPVTGSRPQANDGELLFLVGGDAAVLEKVRPVLAAMSRGIVYLGPCGSGALMKLINNFVCGVQVASLAEAVAWIERSGLNSEEAISILTEGAPGSPLVRRVAGRMQQQDYDVHFRLDLMAKDLLYASREGRQAGLELLSAGPALSVFRNASDKGLGDRDLSAVVEVLRPSNP